MRLLLRVVAITVVTLALIPPSARATVVYQTVDGWLADCRADSRHCFAYLNGLVQGLTLEDMVLHDSHPPGEFCEGTNATIPQIADVLRDYVKRHPTKLDAPVASVLRLAMIEALCQ